MNSACAGLEQNVCVICFLDHYTNLIYEKYNVDIASILFKNRLSSVIVDRLFFLLLLQIIEDKGFAAYN